MKALVTGVAGFVGSRIAARLIADGWEVVGVDVFSDYYDPSIKRSNVARISSERFTFLEADLLTIDLRQLMSGVEAIFHQAGQPGVRSSWGDEFATYTRSNIDVTQRLLEAARNLPQLRRFVYASSSSVYGEAERYPTLETDRPAPVSPYGVTKLAAEHLCSLYASNFGLPTVSLRYFTVYGPGQRTDMAFTRFTRAAVQGTAITLYGSGEQIRDFTFVDDVVDANLKAVEADVPPGTVLNISGGSHITVNDAIEIIRELHGGDITVTRMEGIPGDVSRTGGENSEARRLLNWEPKTDIRAGLAKHYEWAKETY